MSTLYTVAFEMFCKGNYILDSVGVPWLERPHGLFSLWDIMKKFDAAGLYDLGVFVGRTFENSLFRAVVLDAEKRDKIDYPDLLATEVARLRDLCASLGLSLSVASLDKILERLPDPDFTSEKLRWFLMELMSRNEDHLKAITFLYVRSERTKFFSEPLIGWHEACAKFPSAMDDVSEAGKCLATERGTATVFHLMRVLESGLKALASPLGIPYAPSWESYLRQIAAKLAMEWKDKEPEWKRDEEFYREAAAHLSAVKFAFRNPTMHIVKQYNTESAEEIYHSARAFMRHLATKLKE